MVSVKVMAFAGVATVMASAANAADMPQLLPPMPVPYYEDFARGWYLRGDIGMSNQRVDSLFNVLYNTTNRVDTVFKEFDSAPIFGIGFGYQFNNWVRFDVTGEYRGGASFHGLDIVESGGSTFTDEYRAIKSEWLLLANVYADFGTWAGFTPFVGVGVGGSRNTISSFMDICTTCPGGGVATGAETSKFNFAWALHAGIAYKVTNNLTVEFAYRYLSLGDALSGDLVTYLGQNSINNPMEFRDLTSHDLRFGVRWMFDTGPAPVKYDYPPAPVKYDYPPPPPKYDYPPPPPRYDYPPPQQHYDYPPLRSRG